MSRCQCNWLLLEPPPPTTESKGKAESEILVLPTYDMYGGRVDRVSVDVFLSL